MKRADGPRFGNGGEHGRRMSVDVEPSEVGKAYRQYAPEHRRQRRLGMAEATLIIGGTAAGAEGTRRIVSDTKRLRSLPISGGKSGVTRLGDAAAGKGALKIARKPGGLVVGGLSALGAAGAVRHRAETNKGRPWD